MKEFGWAFLRNQSWFDRFLYLHWSWIFFDSFVFIRFYSFLFNFMWFFFDFVRFWFDLILFVFFFIRILFVSPYPESTSVFSESKLIRFVFFFKSKLILFIFHFLLVSQFILDFISELNNNRCCLPHCKFTVYSHSHQHDWYLLMNNNKWIIFYTCD